MQFDMLHNYPSHLKPYTVSSKFSSNNYEKKQDSCIVIAKYRKKYPAATTSQKSISCAEMENVPQEVTMFSCNPQFWT
jgi:hypothetical protein